MSHTVTVRATTTTSTSAILLNVGYFKKPPGILKILQVILGIICVGLTANYIDNYSYIHVYEPSVWSQELFFLLMATTCLITTTLLLFSYVISITSATILPKTVFETVYHLVAAVLLLVSAGLYLIRIVDNKQRIRSYEGRLIASVLGVINAILYGVALFFACRQYRNIS